MGMHVRLLAFDSATEALAIGVDGPLGASVWNGPGGAFASALLLPQVRLLLAQQGLALADLDAIAFGAGPGAFTGLRTVCSVAQGLAMGAGVPVLAVDSLMVVAEDARLQGANLSGGDIGIVMDARMGELYVARYRWSGLGWATTLAPSLARPSDLSVAWQTGGPALLAGSGIDMIESRPVSAGLIRVVHDRAMATLSLSRALYAAGAAVDAGQALPRYVRDKVALTTAERQWAAAPVIEAAQ